MSKQPPEYVRLTVRVPRSKQDRLRALARRRRASVAALARQAIEDYIAREDRAGKDAPAPEAARQRAHLRLLRTTLLTSTVGFRNVLI